MSLSDFINIVDNKHRTVQEEHGRRTSGFHLNPETYHAINNKKTFLRDFLAILKHSFQNY